MWDDGPNWCTENSEMTGCEKLGAVLCEKLQVLKDIYGYLTTMIQISSIWKKSCNVSLWGYLSFAYLWLATFNMKCIVRLLEAPMDSWKIMETPEVSHFLELPQVTICHWFQY